MILHCGSYCQLKLAETSFHDRQPCTPYGKLDRWPSSCSCSWGYPPSRHCKILLSTELPPRTMPYNSLDGDPALVGRLIVA